MHEFKQKLYAELSRRGPSLEFSIGVDLAVEASRRDYRIKVHLKIGRPNIGHVSINWDRWMQISLEEMVDRRDDDWISERWGMVVADLTQILGPIIRFLEMAPHLGFALYDHFDVTLPKVYAGMRLRPSSRMWGYNLPPDGIPLNEVPFIINYKGHTITLEPDREEYTKENLTRLLLFIRAADMKEKRNGDNV